MTSDSAQNPKIQSAGGNEQGDPKPSRQKKLNLGSSQRFRDFRRESFMNAGLQGFDFTGSQLPQNFDGAVVAGARFDQAVLGNVGTVSGPGRISSWVANLAKSGDWIEHCKSWRPSDDWLDRHLMPGDVFQDAPFGPRFVVVPIGVVSAPNQPERKVRLTAPVAVAEYPLTWWELWFFAQRCSQSSFPELRGKSAEDAFDDSGLIRSITWEESELYLDWLSQEVGPTYRRLSEAEWIHARHHGTFGNVDGTGQSWEWLDDYWTSDGVFDEDGFPFTGGNPQERVVCIDNLVGRPHRRREATSGRNFALRVARTLMD